jgi:hypothetical protein
VSGVFLSLLSLRLLLPPDAPVTLPTLTVAAPSPLLPPQLLVYLLMSSHLLLLLLQLRSLPCRVTPPAPSPPPGVPPHPHSTLQPTCCDALQLLLPPAALPGDTTRPPSSPGVVPPPMLKPTCCEALLLAPPAALPGDTARPPPPPGVAAPATGVLSDSSSSMMWQIMAVSSYVAVTDAGGAAGQ